MTQAKKRKRRRPRPGDVFEVSLQKGFGYVQYVGKHPKYDETYRVLPGLFPNPLDDAELQQLVEKQAYYAFVPIRYALDGEPIPYREDADGTVIHRMRTSLPPGVSVPRRVRIDRLNHWAIEEDGIVLYCSFELSEEDRKLPLGEIWSIPLLFSNMEEGYHPSNEILPLVRQYPEVWKQVREEAQARREKATVEPSPEKQDAEDDPEPIGAVTHFLYFRTKRQASRAIRELRKRGFEVQGPDETDDNEWRVLVRQQRHEEDRLELSYRLEQVAARYGGEYDGWEVRVS